MEESSGAKIKVQVRFVCVEDGRGVSAVKPESESRQQFCMLLYFNIQSSVAIYVCDHS